MKTNFGTLALAALVGTAASAVSAATASIEGFTAVGGASGVTITYTLTGAGYVTAEVLCGDTPLSGVGRITGDVNRKFAEGGTYKAYWYPDKADEKASYAASSLKVRLNVRDLTDAPDYCVVDLTRAQYIRYYENAVSVPMGITNDLYKTDFTAFRRIHVTNQPFLLGGVKPVTLTNDYWIGVFPLTKYQYETTAAAYPSQWADEEDDMRCPASWLSEYVLFGFQLFDNGGRKLSNWNADGPGKFMYKLNADYFNGDHTCVADFKPFGVTEAQWEYACRGGSDEDYYGYTADEVAWHAGNSGGKLHPVGLKKPNGYGLYDMLGGIRELTLDGYRALDTTPATDWYRYPGDTDHNDLYRGGCYLDDADKCKVTSRRGDSSGTGWKYGTAYVEQGFRLGTTLPLTMLSATGTKASFEATIASAVDTRYQDDEPGTLATFDSAGFVLRVISNACDLYGVTPGMLLFLR